MSVDLQLSKLAGEVLESYNVKTGQTLSKDDLMIQIERPSGKSLINILFNTKDPSDNARFTVVVTGFQKFTQLGSFEFRLRQNGGSGDLNDEIQVMEAILSKTDYGFLEAFADSDEYKAYTALIPGLVTSDNRLIKLQSNLLLKTQR